MMDHDHEVDDRSGHSYDDVNVDDPPLTRDDVHRDVYDDFYCGARNVPEDIYTKVLQSQELLTYLEDVDTSNISPALFNEGLINMDDFEHFTNKCIHGRVRRNRLFYTTLTQAGHQPNIVVKVHQALLKSPVNPRLPDALRRCALKQCGVTFEFRTSEHGDGATGDLIKSLRGKQISSSQARELAKSFQLMSAVELGDPPSTDLGALCDLWREKSADATPEGLVESLMCCKGLGKYASGMGRIHNTKTAQNFFSNLGSELPKFAYFLGYPEGVFSPEATVTNNPYAHQVTKFLNMFKMPDCRVSTTEILQKTAKKADALPSRKRHPFSPATACMFPATFDPDDPRRKPPSQMPFMVPLLSKSQQSPEHLLRVVFSTIQRLAHDTGIALPGGGYDSLDTQQAQQQSYERHSENAAGEAFSLPKESSLATVAKDNSYIRTLMYRSDLLSHIVNGEQGDCDIVQQLLDSGATIKIQSEEDGSHPLHLAVTSKSLEMFHTVLLQYEGESVDVVRDDHRTPLMVACSEKQHDFVKSLIQQKADVNAKDSEGLACLHYKETLEHSDIVELFLEHKANVDITTEKNFLTPLAHACYAGLIDAARILLRHLAKVEGAEQSTITPLCYAAGGGHVALVELLIQCGANINRPDKAGRTPIHWACFGKHFDVIQYLAKKGADLEYADQNKQFPLMSAVQIVKDIDLLKLLINLKADVNRTMINVYENPHRELEVTPLMVACLIGELEAVQTLVENKANVNYGSEYTPSALCYAVTGGHYNVVEYLLKLNEITKTLESLADPLNSVLQSKSQPIAKLLLETLGGADRVMVKAPQYGLENIVEKVCEIANVKPSQEALATLQMQEANTADPVPTSRLSAELAKTIQETNRVYSLFIRAVIETSERVSKQRHFVKTMALNEKHEHIAAFVDLYYENKVKPQELFLKFISLLLYPSPAHFIFNKKELFDGQTFKVILREIGIPQLDIVGKLVLVIWQIIDTDEASWSWAQSDGKTVLMALMGPRFVTEVEEHNLLNWTETSTQPIAGVNELEATSLEPQFSSVEGPNFGEFTVDLSSNEMFYHCFNITRYLQEKRGQFSKAKVLVSLEK